MPIVAWSRCLAFATALTAEATLLAVAGAWLAGTEGQLAGWAVAVIGAALAVTAFTGGARWLVLPALAFALSVAVTAAADVNLHGGLGDRTYRPTTLGEVRDGYRLGAGRLEIDLRDVEFPTGDTLLPVRLGVGEVVVLVPNDVCVATRARIGGGYAGALDRQTGGLDVNWENRPSPPPRTPRLVLDAQVGIGALFVADRPFEHSWGGLGSSGSGFQPGAYGTNEACYPTGGRVDDALAKRRGPGGRSRLVALGALLVMNADGSIDLGFAYMAPALVAALGAILLASGLAAHSRRRD